MLGWARTSTESRVRRRGWRTLLLILTLCVPLSPPYFPRSPKYSNCVLHLVRRAHKARLVNLGARRPRGREPPPRHGGRGGYGCEAPGCSYAEGGGDLWEEEGFVSMRRKGRTCLKERWRGEERKEGRKNEGSQILCLEFEYVYCAKYHSVKNRIEYFIVA